MACILFANHVLNHLPSVDFRPYKIGANIEEGMTVPENAPEPIYEYAWRFRVNGTDQIVVTNGDYPTVDGEFVDVETALDGKQKQNMHGERDGQNNYF